MKWAADMKKNANKEKLLVILGPTASGKTGLSIDIARALETEIISGDSMLFYRGFDIGSAKPSTAEQSGIRHHMIDILPPEASYNVTEFLQEVQALITDLNEQGKLPVLVGGTGLYIQSLLEGYAFNQQSEDKEYRAYLERLAEEKGKEYVHGMLEKADPEAARRMHVNDFRRVIRALEVHHLGGEKISQEKSQELVYDAYVMGLNWPRPKLYQRINMRVDIMVQQGLAAEIEGLLRAGVPQEAQAMKGIGYKEILAAINGQMTMEQAIDKVKQNSRHFAKRQVTWYRRMPYIHWYQPDLYQRDGLLANALWDIKGYFGIK